MDKQDIFVAFLGIVGILTWVLVMYFMFFPFMS